MPELPQAIVDVCQRIRAGWLPHRLSTGSWWWGRPANDDGFRLWTEGLVPSMCVAELMEPDEVEAWQHTLHWAAPENVARRPVVPIQRTAACSFCGEPCAEPLDRVCRACAAERSNHGAPTDA